MSEELDRRIAVEVMGEPEPDKPELIECRSEEGEVVGFSYSMDTPSPGGNWRMVQIYEHGDEPEWEPISFSSDLNQAMRAVDKYFLDRGARGSRVLIEYRPAEGVESWRAWLGDFLGSSRGASGNTAAEAVCNLLLALKERGRT